jgi:hypothetical protein
MTPSSITNVLASSFGSHSLWSVYAAPRKPCRASQCRSRTCCRISDNWSTSNPADRPFVVCLVSPSCRCCDQGHRFSRRVMKTFTSTPQGQFCFAPYLQCDSRATRVRVHQFQVGQVIVCTLRNGNNRYHCFSTQVQGPYRARHFIPRDH